MLYREIPADLSARPTLTVLTTSDRAVTATVQLTYMAQGFDWSASYVARMNAETKKLALFASLTIANGGVQSFANARLQVVAGRPRKEDNAPPLAQPNPTLSLRCWPLDITSTHPVYIFERLPWQAYTEELEMESDSSNIIVTGSKLSRPHLDVALSVAVMPAPLAIIAQQEELGDLKLYRVPERVTVAAQAQKQVAMIVRPAAEFDRLYSVSAAEGTGEWQSLPFLLRGKNSREKGLGEPLPAGDVAIFEEVAGRELLVGNAELADLAIDERVELPIGASPDVRWRLTKIRETKKRQDWRVDLTNARDVPVKVEIVVPSDLEDRPLELERGRGGWIFPVEIADNGTASLTYSIKLAVRN